MWLVALRHSLIWLVASLVRAVSESRLVIIYCWLRYYEVVICVRYCAKFGVFFRCWWFKSVCRLDFSAHLIPSRQDLSLVGWFCFSSDLLGWSLSLVGQAPGSASQDGFFQEQLMAFQVWLQFAGEVARNGDGLMSQRPPEQLPVVLQVLLSQVWVCTFGSPFV